MWRENSFRRLTSRVPLPLQVQFKRQQEEGGGVQRVKARLMLVDLAGSERAALAAAGSASQKQVGDGGGGGGR